MNQKLVFKQKTFKLTSVILLSALSIFFLSACSSTSTPRTDRLAETLTKMSLEKGDTQDRILNYNIRSWKYVDNKHIILEARRKEFYLLELRSPCTNLSGALDIGFTSFGSSLTKFERIVVREPVGIDENCSIKEIYALNAIETDESQSEEESKEKPEEDSEK